MLTSLIPKLAALHWNPQPYRPRPSKIGPEQCLRQHVYHALDSPQDPPSDRMHLVLHDSSIHEELSLSWLDQSLFSVSHAQHPITIPWVFIWRRGNSAPYSCSVCQQNVPSDALHGHIDGIITDPIGHMWLLEHKALNHFSFERYWKGAWPLDYFTQIALYLRGLYHADIRLSKAILLIKNKNTSAYLEYELEYLRKPDVLIVKRKERFDGELSVIAYADEDAPIFAHLFHDAISAFHLVHQAATHHMLPERRYLLGKDWQCEYCPYRSLCWASVTPEQSEDTLPLEPAHEAMLQRYQDLKAQRLAIEKEEKDLRQFFLLLLKNAGVRRASGETLELLLKTITQTRLDESRIPATIRQSATVTRELERLDIHRKACSARRQSSAA
ncbi:MAG: hypothetical protein D6690_17960 [Nitrospirae bacterium]|nr:MAG: hypothetical protein D6690_17960 [Nitrospirota bacterium]